MSTKTYYLIDTRCVCCNTAVPEGTWVCPQCMSGETPSVHTKSDKHIKIVYSSEKHSSRSSIRSNRFSFITKLFA